MTQDYGSLPPDLPQPQDDGAARHLKGQQFPKLSMRSTGGEDVDIASLEGWTVLYLYPMTGRPGAALPEGWNEFPGARGCTPQSCAFRDHHSELRALGARVYGLSSSYLDYQLEAKERLELPFELLADPHFELARALRLPTFELEDVEYHKRLTMVVRDGVIRHVFYPVFPPQLNAPEVVSWLKEAHTA